MMILHLVHDEKVVPMAIAQFESICPGQNLFVCCTHGKVGQRFVYEADNVILSNSNRINLIDFNSISKVCIHYLDVYKLKFIYNHHLESRIIVLFIWGGDIYNLYLARRGFQLFSENNSCRRADVLYDDSNLYRKIKWSGTLAKPILEFIKKFITIADDRLKTRFFEDDLEYCVCEKTVISLLKECVTFHRLKEVLMFCYYPIEDVLGLLTDKWCNGNNIMVGNSANFTNNHEYALNYLKDINLSSHTVTVPLSYGGNRAYIDIVSQKFARLPNCKILTKFLPLNDYNKLMLNTSTFVYGNFRSEAWGNILIALYLGAKVYLPRRSPLIEEAMGFGFKIYELETIKDTFKQELTQKDKELNRKVAIDNFSREKNREYIQKICNL